MKKENIFREKLYHHTLPVREGLWDAIESQLPQPAGRKRFPLFWLFLFVASLSGGILMFGLLSPSAPESADGVPASSDLTTVSKESIPVTSTTPVSNPVADKASANISSALVNTVNHGQKILQHAKPASNAKPNIVQSDTENSVAVSGTQPFDLVEYSHNVIPASFLPLVSTDGYQTMASKTSIALLQPDPNCYKFRGSGGTYALSADFFAGPGFSPRNFEDTGGESSVYADARRATERNQYAWGAGARINLHLRNGFAARLGILYEQTGDVFDYTDTLATQSSTRIDSFFAADGTFLYADTNRILVFGTLIKKIHNTYRHLDIPLLLSYEMPMGRTMVMVNAGPVLNLTSSHRGQILDPMLHPRHITPGAPAALPAYKTNVGISLYLGTGVLFPLTDNISALVEPRLLYRFNPVTLDGYPLKEHRHFAGLNLGIRYHLN